MYILLFHFIKMEHFEYRIEQNQVGIIPFVSHYLEPKLTRQTFMEMKILTAQPRALIELIILQKQLINSYEFECLTCRSS